MSTEAAVLFFSFLPCIAATVWFARAQVGPFPLDD